MGGFDLGLIEAQACPPAAAAGGAHGAGGAGAGVDTSAAVAAGVGTTCEIKWPGVMVLALQFLKRRRGGVYYTV